MIRSAAAALGTALLALTATACASTEPRAVPDVTGRPLDVAEDTLDGLGLRYHTVGGGTFGIVVRSHWIVCEQNPPARTVATRVVLTVARSCEIPDVVGESLDNAEEALDHTGVHARVYSLDGTRIVVEGCWTVCRQEPAAAVGARSVDLYVSHDCWDWNES